MSQHERVSREPRGSIEGSIEGAYCTSRMCHSSLTLEIIYIIISTALIFVINTFTTPTTPAEQAQVCPKALTIKPTSTWPHEAHFGMVIYFITRTVEVLFLLRRPRHDYSYREGIHYSIVGPFRPLAPSVFSGPPTSPAQHRHVGSFMASSASIVP